MSKGIFPWLVGAAVGGAAWLVYGALVESNKLVLERKTLFPPKWPKRLHGYRIGVLADIHLRDIYTVDHARRAIDLLLDEAPDVIVLPGDFVGYWKQESPDLLRAVLGPLLLMEGKVFAVPGNHDYWMGSPDQLEPILDELNIKLLRNASYSRDGISWVGIDSANAGKAEPIDPMLDALRLEDPIVVLWHEPDYVDLLPHGASLMISGHTHGGQWRFPWGWTPMTTRGGSKYIEGYFPHAPTPLYVSRGLATTGPPARFGALPEVTILTLESLA